MPPIRTRDADTTSDRRPTARYRRENTKSESTYHFLSSPFADIDDKPTSVELSTCSRASGHPSELSRSPTVFSEFYLTAAGSSDDTKTEVVPPAPPFTEPITVCGIKLHPTVAFDTFWRFAAERKAIDDRRRAGKSPPFTEDSVLRDYFFCNTYRVLDKVCQYLIKEVIEKGSQDPEEVVFRVLLFNSYTKIDTWELLVRELGPLKWSTYDQEKYRKVLSAAANSGMTLYTGAFIKPAPHFGSDQNHVNHLYLIETFMEDQLYSRLLAAPYLADVYEHIVSFPSMGPFSTYQLILCLSYTEVLNFHPNDLVISGPGSISGLNKLFGKSMDKGRRNVEDFEAEVMRYLTTSQEYHFKRLGLEFSGLGPERLPMTVADIEHTLCEVDKYCRIAHPHLKGKRTNLYRVFRPLGARAPSEAFLPKAWSHPARRTPNIRPEKTLVVDKRYLIESLKDHRDSPKGRQFLVYWVGYPPSDASWERESSLLQDAPIAVAEYLRDHGLDSC